MSKPNKGNVSAAAEKAATEKAAAENKAGSATKTKIVQVTALSVVSSREGFRRGGRVWGKEAQVVKLSELTKEQVEQIKGESLLVVTEVEVDEGENR